MDAVRKGFSFSGYERNTLFLNRAGKLVEISGVSGADSVLDARGAVFADFDNDGDMDILIRPRAYDRNVLLLRNNIGNKKNFIRIAVEGRKSGRDAAGTVVVVRTSKRVLTQIKTLGAGFMSQWDPRLLFGLGDAERVESIAVTWPTGVTQQFDGAAAGASLLLVEGELAPRQVDEPRFSLPDPLPVGAQWSRVRLSANAPLPALEIQDLDGVQSKLQDVVAPTGRTLINFWATWCTACATEMPLLQTLHEQSAERRLRVVGISTDDPETREAIPAFIGRLGAKYPNYWVQPDAAIKAISKQLPLPLTLLVDADRRVIDVFVGNDSATRKRLHAALSDGATHKALVSSPLPASNAARIRRLEPSSRLGMSQSAFMHGVRSAIAKSVGKPEEEGGACHRFDAVLQPFCHEGYVAGAIVSGTGEEALSALGQNPLTCTGIGFGAAMQSRHHADAVKRNLKGRPRACVPHFFDGVGFAQALSAYFGQESGTQLYEEAAGNEIARSMEAAERKKAGAQDEPDDESPGDEPPGGEPPEDDAAVDDETLDLTHIAKRMPGRGLKPPTCGPPILARHKVACAFGVGRSAVFESEGIPRKSVQKCDRLDAVLRPGCIAGVAFALTYPFIDDVDVSIGIATTLPADRRAIYLQGVFMAVMVREQQTEWTRPNWLSLVSAGNRAMAEAGVKRMIKCYSRYIPRGGSFEELFDCTLDR